MALSAEALIHISGLCLGLGLTCSARRLHLSKGWEMREAGRWVPCAPEHSDLAFPTPTPVALRALGTTPPGPQHLPCSSHSQASCPVAVLVPRPQKLAPQMRAGGMGDGVPGSLESSGVSHHPLFSWTPSPLSPGFLICNVVRVQMPITKDLVNMCWLLCPASVFLHRQGAWEVSKEHRGCTMQPELLSLLQARSRGTWGTWEERCGKGQQEAWVSVEVGQ